MAAEKVAKITEFKGLIAAPFNAFRPNGELNPDVIPEYVEYLVKNGVKGVFVNGTTGEGLSLSVEERKTVAESWIKFGKNKLDVIIIQVGANSVKDARELASHAERAGATGIASLPPLFYKPPTHEHLIAYLNELSTAAPNLPLMLYHIPSFSGVEIYISDFLPKARRAIPNFCGAKFTSTDVRDLQRCHRLPGPTYKLLSGFEEVLLPCLVSGVTAAVGAVYSFMGPLSLRLLAAYSNGDIQAATDYQKKVSEAVELIVSHGKQPISALKAAMNILSPIDFGPPRVPLVPLKPEEQRQLEADLEKLGASEWTRN